MTTLLALVLLAADPGNVISRIDVREVGDAVEVTISGSRAPSFSTFTALNPPRFVVDLADSIFATDAAAPHAGAGQLAQVVAEQRVAEGLRQARVTLAFAGEVEAPRVTAGVNSVTVSIPSGTARAAAPAAPHDLPPAPAAELPRSAVAGLAPAPGAPRAPQDVAMPAVVAVSIPPPQPLPQPPAPAAELPRSAVAGLAPAPGAPRAPQGVAMPGVAAVSIPAPRPLPESPAPPPVVAATPAVAMHPLPGDRAAAPVEGVRVSEAPALGHETHASRAPPQVLRELGFHHDVTGSRVLLRTSGAPRFSVSEQASSIVVLLEDAHAARANDLRPLDTSFFPSAVRRIVPRRDRDGTRVEIELRGPAAHREEIDGDLLTVVFDPPPPSSPQPPSRAAARR